MRYVAFLRGINVGGRGMIKMEALRRMFEELGFDDVSTHIQSGNVLFSSRKANEESIATSIEKALPNTNPQVMVRSAKDLVKIVSLNPFKPRHNESKRRFVTFLRYPASGPLVARNAEILLRTPREIFWYYPPKPGRARARLRTRIWRNSSRLR